MLLLTLCWSCSLPAEKNKSPIQDTTNLIAVHQLKLDSHFLVEQVEGSFIWYDLKKGEYHIYNYPIIHKRHSPASTFKIFNACVALETGVIKDTTQIITWDSIDRGWDKWNKDQTLGSGIRYSALWAYQEIARWVDEKDPSAYQHFIDRANYGNKTISDTTDQFWIDNSLQISPLEQIEFLVKFYQEELPFDQKNIKLVKNLITVEEKSDYSLRGKTGWAKVKDSNIGWYVGYVETKADVFFFCTNIQPLNKIKSKSDFRAAYIRLTHTLIEEIMELSSIQH